MISTCQRPQASPLLNPTCPSVIRNSEITRKHPLGSSIPRNPRLVVPCAVRREVPLRRYGTSFVKARSIVTARGSGLAAHRYTLRSTRNDIVSSSTGRGDERQSQYVPRVSN